MRIDWFSQTGSNRANNCDAGCYGMTEQVIAVAIVDAAESKKAPEFARHWARTLVTAASTFGYSKDASRILDELVSAQSELRYIFLQEIASYALAVIHLRTGEGILLSAGDCLIGISEGSSVDLDGVAWINSPHTADRQLSEMGEPARPASGIENVLTRSINAKRFAQPDMATFLIREGQCLILATDGYWREPPKQGGSQKSDDSSALSLAWTVGDLTVHQESDIENLGTYRGSSNP